MQTLNSQIKNQQDVLLSYTRSVLASLSHSLMGRCMHNVDQWVSVHLNVPPLRMFAKLVYNIIVVFVLVVCSMNYLSL